MQQERIQTGSDQQNNSIIGNEFDIIQEHSIKTDDFLDAAGQDDEFQLVQNQNYIVDQGQDGDEEGLDDLRYRDDQEDNDEE